MGIIKKAVNIIKFVANPAKSSGIKTTNNVVPFGPPAAKAAQVGPKVISGIGSIGKTLYSGAKSLISTKAVMPSFKVAEKLVPALTKTSIGRAAGGAIKGAATYGTYEAVKQSAQSNLPTGVKAIITGAGIGLSPLGAAAGLIEGIGRKGAKTAADKFREGFGHTKEYLGDIIPQISNKADAIKRSTSNSMREIYDNLPTSPIPQFQIDMPDIGTLPTSPTIIMQNPIPSVQGPAFNPSFSVGGGGGLSENLPLLLLLGAGFGGFALGRAKRRKKKRYKKSKRHKK